MLKRSVWTLGLGLLLVGCGGGPSVTPSGKAVSGQALPSGATACFYTDAGFRGASFCASGERAWVGRRWSDRISSVRLAPGYSIQLFRDINYGGGAVALEADVVNLRDLGFNDQTSSFKIIRNGGSVTDTTPPTVSNVTSSRDTITTPDPVTLSADATDNVGVTRVEFYANNVKIGEATKAPYTVTFDPASLPNGEYYSSAKAFDAAGNSSIDSGRGFQIKINRTGDLTKPTASNLTVSKILITDAQPVTMTVNASDNVAVTKAQFNIGGVVAVAPAGGPSYKVTLDTSDLPNGTYYSGVIVSDAEGNFVALDGPLVTVKR